MMKLIALAALAGLMLAGCTSVDAETAQREAFVAEAVKNNPVPGMAERIDAARRPSTNYWRDRGAIVETRTIRCRTDVYSNFSSTHCR